MTQEELQELQNLQPAAKVEFTLPDSNQVYTMIWDFNKVCDSESLSGENLMPMIMAWADATARKIRAMLHALLSTAHAVTLEEAGQLLNKGQNAKVMAHLIQVLSYGRDQMSSEAEPVAEIVPEPEPKPTEPAVAA